MNYVANWILEFGTTNRALARTLAKVKETGKPQYHVHNPGYYDGGYTVVCYTWPDAAVGCTQIADCPTKDEAKGIVDALQELRGY